MSDVKQSSAPSDIATFEFWRKKSWRKSDFNTPVNFRMSGITNGAVNKEITATFAACTILSWERNPPLDPHQYCTKDGRVPLSYEQVSQMFDCFPDFSLTMVFNSSPDLQFESAWAFTNIASRILDQTKAVVSAAAVAEFIFTSSSYGQKNSFANPMQILHHVLDT